jgi:hypothetical protein
LPELHPPPWISITTGRFFLFSKGVYKSKLNNLPSISEYFIFSEILTESPELISGIFINGYIFN